MQKLFILLSFLICTECVSQEVMELWPNAVPGATVQKGEPTTKPDQGDAVTRITDVSNPTLTHFPAKGQMKSGVSVVVCPGGGYQHLAIDKEGSEIAKWLNSIGISAFVLTYRVPNQEAGAIQDLQRAIRTVRGNAAEWELDPNQIGVIGFSAGANLAVWSQVKENMTTYPKADNFDDLSCAYNFSMLIYPARFDSGPNRSLTSGITIPDNAPPTFIFASADDTHANSALVMAGAIRDAGNPIELHLLPEGGHGYGLRSDNAAGAFWPILATKWLTGVLK